MYSRAVVPHYRGMLPILLVAAAGTLIPAVMMWLADQRARGQH
jgi:hypothetical protein